jgi:hypothetical protein
VGSADGTGVWLKTPRVWLAMLDILNLLFSERLGGIGGRNWGLTENPQGLAGNAGDLELVLLGNGEAGARLPDQVQRFLKTHRFQLIHLSVNNSSPLQCSSYLFTDASDGGADAVGQGEVHVRLHVGSSGAKSSQSAL